MKRTILVAIGAVLGVLVVYFGPPWTPEPREEQIVSAPISIPTVETKEAPIVADGEHTLLEREPVSPPESEDNPGMTGNIDRDARFWAEGAEVEFIDWSSLPALSKEHARPSDLFAVVNDKVVCKVDATRDDSDDLLAVKLDYLENRSVAAFLILKSFKAYGEVSGVQKTRVWSELEQERDGYAQAIRDLGALPSFRKIYEMSANR